jgi:sulfur-carrier protein
MPTVVFTRNLQRHVAARDCTVDGHTVGAVLDTVFGAQPEVRSYVLDDQGELRKHMGIFVDGVQIADRCQLTDPVNQDSRIDIIQSLSGG